MYTPLGNVGLDVRANLVDVVDCCHDGGGDGGFILEVRAEIKVEPIRRGRSPQGGERR